MGFVGNLLILPAVKEFWKSVKNWPSYRHEFGVLLFWKTLYKYTQCTRSTYAYARISTA